MLRMVDRGGVVVVWGWEIAVLFILRWDLCVCATSTVWAVRDELVLVALIWFCVCTFERLFDRRSGRVVSIKDGKLCMSLIFG